MSQPQTNFYHKHIQANIQRLDERKDKFIHHRLDFLKEFCEPIQLKINQTQAQIERYKIMRDTQTEVIQNQPKVKQIKAEIQNYVRTHDYYQQKINQLSKQCLKIQQHNERLSQQIILLNYSIKAHPIQLGFHLPSLNHHNRYNTALRSSKIYTEDIQKTQQSLKTMTNRKLVRISQKIQKIRTKDKREQEDLKEGLLSQIVQTKREQGESYEWKQKLHGFRQKLNKFNKTESLFTECFQAKKSAIQKSVSQLQSKLITNRQQFLNICQAIGSKENKISFDQFKKLSCDEIVTLFISFVWLNRKLSSRLRNKRGLILDAIKKIGGLW